MNAQTIAGLEVDETSRASRGIVLGLSFAAGALLLVFLFPFSAEYSDLERMNYLTLMFAYFIISVLLLRAVIVRDLSLFEPLSIVTALIFCTFILYPMHDVLVHDMVSHGKDVSSGCIKATLIVLASYTLLYILYYTGKDAAAERVLAGQHPKIMSEQTRKNCNTLMIGIWTVSFIASISVMLQSGMSLSYLFSLGTKGEYVISEERTLLLFLSNFGITLATSWVYLLFNADSVVLKVVLTILTYLYAFARMSRWLVLVVVAAPIVYYHSLTRRRVSWSFVFVTIVLFILVAAWMQIYRYDFRQGEIADFSFTFDFATLMGPLRSDFTTYRAFYGMVKEIPANHAYFLGKSTFLNFFITAIPRAFWPGKPVKAPVSEIIAVSINDSAATSGVAFYNIGEYYADFGPLGAMILMGLFGYILGRFLEPKRQSSDTSDLLAFAVMYPLLFQWTARGNTGANVWLTIFALMPVVFLRALGGEER